MSRTDDVEDAALETAEPEAAQALAKKKKKPKKEPGLLSSRRGVQTLFRVSYREQLDLTALADEKAGMMIQVNGLIMSIMIASAGLIIGAHSWLLLPCVTLTLTALVSIVFAVFAARPKLNKPTELDIARHQQKAEKVSRCNSFFRY